MTVSRKGKTELFAQWLGGDLVVTDQGNTGTGLRYWVDSNGAGADTAGHGHSPTAAYLTVDYAISQCVADRGDIIYVMEGHEEDGDAVIFDADIAGISIIGLGNGTNRPEFHYNNAAATVDVGANNIKFRNLKFMPSVPTVLIGIDVEADVTGFDMQDCLFYEGEDGGGLDEFVVTVDLKGGNTDTLIKHNDIRTDLAANGCTEAIIMTAASTNVRIHDNIFTGNWSTAAITDGAACVSVSIANNWIKVLDGEPGIELTATTTGQIIGNRIESTGVNPELAIVAADCAWFGNSAVVTDGSGAVTIGGTDESAAIIAGVLAGAMTGDHTGDSTGVGTVTAIQSAVTSSGIANNAQTSPLTAATTGVWILEEIITETDATGWAAPANIEFSTDNTFGLTGVAAPIGLEAMAAFGANLTNSSKDWTSSALPCTLEAGSILYIHGDTLAGTGAGVGNVTMILRRVTAGATITAVDVP